MFRAGYWTSQTRLPELSRLWREVLPGLAPLVAREPERVSGALSNAAVNLDAYSARLDQWLNELARVGPLCESVSQLLQVNGVLAWRAGLARLRNSSLNLLRGLPPELAARTMGLKGAFDGSDWPQTLNRICRDRWFDPAKAAEPGITKETIREVARVADYRGMGGELMDLPVVFMDSEQLYVTDLQNTYRMEVDCFGCNLHAAPEVTLPKTPRMKSKNVQLNGWPSIDAVGKVVWRNHERHMSYLAASNSQACDGQTLAVTIPTSFHVYLINCAEEP